MKYLRIPKRIGCHTEGIPERELPPSPPPKGRFDPPHRNVWIAFFRGSATSTNQGRSRNVLQTGRQELDASVVPLKAVNAVLNEDETEIRTLFLRFLSRCFWMDLALFTKKYTTSGTDGARSSYLRKRRNLMSVNNSTCSTVKPSLNVTSTKKAPYSFANLPTCFWRTSGFILIQPRAQRMYWSVAKIYSCPVHTSVPRTVPTPTKQSKQHRITKPSQQTVGQK